MEPDSSNWTFRLMARNIFLAGFECTDKKFNNEVTPKALMIDTRANPCVLLDKYEQAIMWTVGIYSKEDIGLKDCPKYFRV